MTDKKMHLYDIRTVLELLQAGHDLGLAASTLKVQTAALSVYFDTQLAEHPQVYQVLPGTGRKTNPTRSLSVPPCDLHLVLAGLTIGPFEPLETCDSVLTWKMVFLVAITTAQRVSELQALSVKEPFLRILQTVILWSDPAF